MNNSTLPDVIELPSPGIHKDVPFETYLKWPAVSNSKINLARKSLLHYREAPFKEPTKAMRFGTFTHCGVLEPLAIGIRYAVMPAYERDPQNVTQQGKRSTAKTTEYYTVKAEEFMTANAGKEIVEEAEYNRLCAISKRIQNHPVCREWMGRRGESELSMVWYDDETGLPCKARIDFLSELIVDLKTTRDAMQFEKSIATFGYHRQAAHYRNGYATLTGEILPFGLIAVETEAPFPVRAAVLDDEAVSIGEKELREALTAISDAQESGVWKSYEDPKTWTLPGWYAETGPELELIIGGESITV